MKVILLVVVMVLLSSCGEIPGWRIEMAVKKCADHGGVNHMTTTEGITTSWAICTDGTQVKINIDRMNKVRLNFN